MRLTADSLRCLGHPCWSLIERSICWHEQTFFFVRAAPQFISKRLWPRYKSLKVDALTVWLATSLPPGWAATPGHAWHCLTAVPQGVTCGSSCHPTILHHIKDGAFAAEEREQVKEALLPSARSLCLNRSSAVLAVVWPTNSPVTI